MSSFSRLPSDLYSPDSSNSNHSRFRAGPIDWHQRRCVNGQSGHASHRACPCARAAHQLQTAAVELENIRASVNDVTLRNITTLMLLGIYLEEGNYGRSQSLLEETFANARGPERRVDSHLLRRRRADDKRHSRAPGSLSQLTESTRPMRICPPKPTPISIACVDCWNE